MHRTRVFAFTSANAIFLPPPLCPLAATPCSFAPSPVPWTLALHHVSPWRATLLLPPALNSPFSFSSSSSPLPLSLANLLLFLPRQHLASDGDECVGYLEGSRLSRLCAVAMLFVAASPPPYLAVHYLVGIVDGLQVSHSSPVRPPPPFRISSPFTFRRAAFSLDVPRNFPDSSSDPERAIWRD